MKYIYKQVAKANIGPIKYQVVEVNGEYYQVQRNRKKIGENMQKRTYAMKKMLQEAEDDLIDLFIHE